MTETSNASETSSLEVGPFLEKIIAQQPLAGRHTLIIVENLPLPFDRRVWNEARTLKVAGADVSIICPTSKGYETPYEVIEGIEIYRHSLPLDAKGALGYLLEYSAALWHELTIARKIWKKKRFDLIHACNPPDLIFLVASVFRGKGARFLFDHHDINPELYEAKFNRRDIFWNLMCWLEKKTFSRADAVISTNQSYAKIARTRGGKADEDVFVVRSGPEVERLTPVPPNPSWKNGRAHMVGYVGVMGDQEGIDLLLETARIMNFEMKCDIQFVLVGGGPALDGLKSMTQELGLSDHVTFTGRAPDADLFEVLSTADVCVNPDRVNPMNDQSTMNKILEYMAFMKPIVQFDVTEGRFSAGDASLYARANDTAHMAELIKSIIDDPDMGEKMGTIGRARIKNELSWDHQVNALIEAYQRALQK